MKSRFFCHFIPQSSNGALLVPPPSLMIMSLVFYHSATAAGQFCQRQKTNGKILDKKDSLSVTVERRSYYVVQSFLPFYPAKFQRLSPCATLSHDHESSVLPLCHCRWPILPKTKNQWEDS